MAEPPNPWRRFLARPNSDRTKTVGIALIVAAICGLCISTTSVLLRPLIAVNVEADRQGRMSAMLAGLPGIGAMLAQAGADAVEAVIIDLDQGRIAEGFDPSGFDQAAVAADPSTSTALARAEDLAGIGRRENFAQAYVVRSEGERALVVLPVYGNGYQSTIRAYLALEADLATVAAFTVYEQGETPGLGARIAEPAWQAQWAGKSLSRDGEIVIEVVRGSAGDETEVDGISGASVTGYAVTDMIHFWLGPKGFGPWLDTLRNEDQ